MSHQMQPDPIVGHEEGRESRISDTSQNARQPLKLVAPDDDNDSHSEESDNDDEEEDSDDALSNMLEVFRLRDRKSSKRMKQLEQHIQILESRIHHLESNWATLAGTRRETTGADAEDKTNGPDQATSSISTGARSPKSSAPRFPRSVQELATVSEASGETAALKDSRIIPTVNHQFWADFQARPSQHVIDILLGGPEAKLYAVPEKSPQVKDIDDALNNMVGKTVPDRARINSVLVQTALKKALHIASESHGIKKSEGWTIFRPFKALVSSEEQIKAHFRYIEQTLRRVLEQQDTRVRIKSLVEKDETRNSVSELDHHTWQIFLSESDLYCCEDCLETYQMECPTVEHASELFTCIPSFIDRYIRPISQGLRTRSAKHVDFQDLWYLFQAGDNVIVRRQDPPTLQALRILGTHGGRRVTNSPCHGEKSRLGTKHAVSGADLTGFSPIIIDAFMLDFNGKELTPTRERFEITRYKATKYIKSLCVYPIECEGRAAQDELVKRGQQFVGLIKPEFGTRMTCQGVSLATGEEISGEMIVDSREYLKNHSEAVPTFTPAKTLDISEINNYVSTEAVVQTETKPLEGEYYLSDADHLICHHRLYACSPQTQMWVRTYVDDVAKPNLISRDQTFDRLVLSFHHKEMLRSLVVDYYRREIARTAGENTIDLVRGRRQGVIILLHGASGTGKTLTAESVADLVNKPLYVMNCGDLGTTSRDVEDTMTWHLKLARRWNCVMLLDEADVFLAQRTQADYERNSVVSVFLRLLDGYQGILFLTTNRLASFDDAFKSRFHLTLYYNTFDEETYITVWKMFIRRAEDSFEATNNKSILIDEEGIIEYAQRLYSQADLRWNGRQIRNAFQTALAMALAQVSNDTHGTIRLGPRQFKSIAESSLAFDNQHTEASNLSNFQDRYRYRPTKKFNEQAL